MEPKKNPKYDIHRKRGVLLNVGLITSLILVISAFQWKMPVSPVVPSQFGEPLPEVDFENPRVTDFKIPAPSKPKPVQITVRTLGNIVEAKNPTALSEATATPDQGAAPEPLNFGTIEMPTEIIKADTFRTVEKMPEPIGGWPAFYAMLSKNIKYPKKAERQGVGGKVYVEFTVNDKGELSNFKILKGVGFGCDEEAKRVISLTRWNAGKQRGRPVNVRMVQPISFNLNY